MYPFLKSAALNCSGHAARRAECVRPHERPGKAGSPLRPPDPLPEARSIKGQASPNPHPAPEKGGAVAGSRQLRHRGVTARPLLGGGGRETAALPRSREAPATPDPGNHSSPCRRAPARGDISRERPARLAHTLGRAMKLLGRSALAAVLLLLLLGLHTARPGGQGRPKGACRRAGACRGWGTFVGAAPLPGHAAAPGSRCAIPPQL